jgi:hypothetical protein
MKTSLVTIAAALAMAVAVPATASTSYGGITFPDGDVSFADSVFSYAPGAPLGSGTGCETASDALGVPDHVSGNCNNYVSLGRGGTLILQFTDNSLTTSGDSTADLHIFEIGSAVEAMMVAISTNANNPALWIDLGRVSGQPTSIDIDGIAGVVAGTKYSFVRIMDDPNSGPHSGVFAGADIDAVGAISSAAAAQIPLPAGGLLLLSALAAAPVLRRKSRA